MLPWDTFWEIALLLADDLLQQKREHHLLARWTDANAERTASNKTRSTTHLCTITHACTQLETCTTELTQTSRFATYDWTPGAARGRGACTIH